MVKQYAAAAAPLPLLRQPSQRCTPEARLGGELEALGAVEHGAAVHRAAKARVLAVLPEEVGEVARQLQVGHPVDLLQADDVGARLLQLGEHQRQPVLPLQHGWVDLGEGGGSSVGG
jgi:hypothetical protein